MTPTAARRTSSGSSSASTAHASFDAPPGSRTGSEIGPSTASSASRMSAIIAAMEERRERVRAFMEEHVYPNEQALTREDDAADALVRELQQKAKDAGLWAPHLPREAGGSAFAVVMVVTEPEAEPHRRASLILVPTDTPGYELVRRIPVMGHEGRGWGTHCETRFTGVRVPVSNTLGEPGDGFRITQKRLGPGRIHHVMRWLGQMERAFELMCERALEREAFGRT